MGSEAIRCVGCGTKNPRSNRFCGRCGIPLVGHDRQLDPFERRRVAILFADLSGFTAMSETLDPEEVTEFINRYFKMISRIIYQHEGYIDKFIGDEVMAIFGAPIARENSCERAVRSALEARDQMASLPKTSQELSRSTLSVGIHYGPVQTGPVGSDLKLQYTAIGDTVNVAKRLEETAPAGEIYVSSTVYAHTRAIFDYRPLPPIRLRGKRNAITPYRVRGVKRRVGRRRGIHGIETPMVGRKSALARIQQEIDRLVVHHRSHKRPIRSGKMIGITGDPGVGKTRLRRELHRYVQHLEASQRIPVRWLTAEALPYEMTPSGWLPKEMLRTLARIDQHEDDSWISAQLDRLTEEEPESLPYLLRLFDVRVPKQAEKLDPEAFRDNLFIVTRRILAREAERGPLIVALEDLHWADSLSQEFVAYLRRFITELPLLILMFYRIDGHPPSITGTQFTEITLRPLRREEADELLERLLGKGSDPALLRLIRDRAEGNPFFIEEMVNSLLEDGVLERNRGRLRSTEKVEKIELPGTVEEVLAARIDRLPVPLKTLLRRASVIGRTFSYLLLDHVTRALGDDPEALTEQIDRLEKRRLLVKIDSKTDSDPPEHRFNHVLIQEAAYRGLPPSQRRLLHRQVAEAIEAVFQDRPPGFYATLAHHYLQADKPRQALRYTTLALKESVKEYQHERGLRLAKRGLELLDRTTEVFTADEILKNRFNLLTNRVEIYDTLGRRAAQARDLDALLGLAETLGDRRYLSDIYNKRALLYRHIGRYSEAKKAALRGFEMKRDLNDLRGEAESLSHLGVAQVNLGEYQEGLDHHRQAYRIRKWIQDLPGQGNSLNGIGVAYVHLGHYGKALRVWEQAAELFERIGDRRGEGTILNNIGVVHMDHLGAFREALGYYHRAQRIMEEIGDRQGEGAILINIGEAYHNLKRYQKSLEYLQRARRIKVEIDDHRGEAKCLILLGEVYRDLREFKQAATHLERSLTLSRELGLRSLEIQALIARSLVHIELDEKAIALHASRRAVALLEKGSDNEAAPEVYLIHFKVLLATGREWEAERYLKQAYEAIMKQANRIEADGLRHCFLEHAPVNREIIAAWRNRKRS